MLLPFQHLELDQNNILSGNQPRLARYTCAFISAGNRQHLTQQLYTVDKLVESGNRRSQ